MSRAGSRRLVHGERAGANPARVDVQEGEPVTAGEARPGIDVPAVREVLHLIHDEMPMHQRPKPVDRLAAVPEHFNLGPVDAKQRDVDVSGRPGFPQRDPRQQMEFRPWKDQEPGLGRSVFRARGGHHRICRHVTGARVSAPRHSLLTPGQLLRQVVGFGERWFDDLQSTGQSLRSARVHVTG